MKYADEIMAMTPDTLRRVRGLAVGGDQEALREYGLWSIWSNLANDKRLTIREARGIFRKILKAWKFEVTLDG
jgi:hypothetical protein